MIDLPLAREIVERTMKIIPFSVNVMDRHGTIVASGSPERIGSAHLGAQLALARRSTVEIDDSSTAHLHGAKPGINLLLVVRGDICGVIGLTGQPDQVRQFAELVRLTAEMILERARLTGELQREKRYREEFVFQLVHRTGVSDASMAAWAARLAIDVRLPRAMFVLEVTGASHRMDLVLTELQHVQAALAMRWPDLLTAVVSPGELVMLEGFDTADSPMPRAQRARKRLHELHEVIRPALQFASTLAVGVALPGLDGATASYESARHTARVGRRREPAATVFSYFELHLPVLLSSLQSGWQAEQLRQTLHKLKAYDQKNGVLVKTLMSWFKHNNHPALTAQALHIHRNTLDYRLQKIGELTGLDLAIIDDRLMLYVALQITPAEAGD
ncbi:sugar diacid recognition domain-containing protein [Herbaspirillum sp. YR522]|uniref:sugar diacid recognition domain-containing protein n=1 Tax=Herbaspirillum sp. YR522 TaxID=1144342 RepID=UPI00026FCD42|nr:sugar diacid recognition domain-containing protein [Herbaspirillum sp. YR522]EJN05748.1 sugar diacid utilization regulator [Herbaspirillum sp. YR522]